VTKFERQPEPVESNELLAFINVALRFDLPDLILAERDMGSRINPEPGHSNMAFSQSACSRICSATCRADPRIHGWWNFERPV